MSLVKHLGSTHAILILQILNLNKIKIIAEKYKKQLLYQPSGAILKWS